MRQPKEPTKPRQPSKPNKYLPSQKEHYSIWDGTTLDSIIQATSGIDPANVRFTSTRGYYDDYDYQFEWDGKPRLNPRYEHQMAVYNRKMEKYRKAMEIYNSNLKEYKSLHKQYLKWYHEDQLKKLG